MTEKELRRMRAPDLVKLLLKQGGENAKMEQELEEKEAKLKELREDNESIKGRLDACDTQTEQIKEWLNQRDIRIAELRTELTELQQDKWIDLEEIGSITDAAEKLNRIFQFAQQQADVYLSGIGQGHI